jgi:hypothetical protein
VVLRCKRVGVPGIWPKRDNRKGHEAADTEISPRDYSSNRLSLTGSSAGFFVGPEEERMTGALITGIVTLGLLIYLLVSHYKPDLFS